MSSNLKDINFAELTKEQIENIERQNKTTLRSSYMIEFTKKKIDKSHGYGKINAFVDGDRLNPKLAQTGTDPNSLYIKIENRNYDLSMGFLRTKNKK